MYANARMTADTETTIKTCFSGQARDWRSELTTTNSTSTQVPKMKKGRIVANEIESRDESWADELPASSAVMFPDDW